MVLMLYWLLVWRILAVGSATQEPFGRLVCVGIAALIAVQVLINTAMMATDADRIDARALAPEVETMIQRGKSVLVSKNDLACREARPARVDSLKNSYRKMPRARSYL